jgi:16S rRNA (guanine527-N7)-methyltransferase
MSTEKQLFTEKLTAVFERHGLAELLSPERADGFYTLYRFLVEENEKYNLTAVTDEDGVILLHFADSLMGASLLPKGARVIDIGCGAGFPSLPLALCRPDLTVTATDATAKKCAFVAAAAERLGLSNLKTLTGRAEALGREEAHRDAYDAATARAVAALPMLLELTAPFVRRGGRFLALKGRTAAEELAASRHAAGELKCKVIFTKEYEIGEGEAAQGRGILLFEKTAPTPETYPRPFARIKSRPL